MDRTSILADTIEYTKELIEKINNLQQEMELGPNQLSLMSIFKNEKPIEMFLRNSPKVCIFGKIWSIQLNSLLSIRILYKSTEKIMFMCN